ncbi:MAG: preprotein translocase subunit SecE [Patescibacteria group bacterium]
MGLANYFRETRVELRQVTWPTRRQTLVYTIVVVVLSLGVALFLGLFDVIFSWLLKLIFS